MKVIYHGLPSTLEQPGILLGNICKGLILGFCLKNWHFSKKSQNMVTDSHVHLKHQQTTFRKTCKSLLATNFYNHLLYFSEAFSSPSSNQVHRFRLVTLAPRNQGRKRSLRGTTGSSIGEERRDRAANLETIQNLSMMRSGMNRASERDLHSSYARVGLHQIDRYLEAVQNCCTTSHTARRKSTV